MLTPFNPAEPQHRAARQRAKKLCMQLNTFRVDQTKARQPVYQELFGSIGSAFIEPDFFCDYGYNIFIGENFFANHHCIMLDAATITIGDRVLLGPSVHLYTTTHPLDAHERASGMQLTAPIVIEDDCWIGGNSVIMPGVTIGKGAVIGAGSVVTKSIPAGAVAFGNPCKIHSQ
ncbi:MAG TPA: sugar O-acetyltransferase [Pseudomonadales bacterium]|nr:sugar O-acetyltransferase [Pseudomonadales bacterium]